MPTMLMSNCDLLLVYHKLIYDNRPLKMIFLMSKNFRPLILIPKVGVKINIRMITKNHAPDQEIRFLTKSILKPYGHAIAMSRA